ncbi:MAG: shikimate kinase [Deltaproteobacteria bacterium]|nr:shikimate kinase [Deltaproteobacteria bacterium]
MRLALIGPRGAGKSTVAALVGARLDLPAMSVDDEIVKRTDRTIREIVAEHGWPEFRRLESEMLADLLDTHAERLVLDCGGGIVENERNRHVLRETDLIVYLTASVETLSSRYHRGTDQRPALTAFGPAEEIRRVLAEREPLYQELADFVIETDRLSPEECAEEIARELDRRGQRKDRS